MFIHSSAYSDDASIWNLIWLFRCKLCSFFRGAINKSLGWYRYRTEKYKRYLYFCFGTSTMEIWKLNGTGTENMKNRIQILYLVGTCIRLELSIPEFSAIKWSNQQRYRLRFDRFSRRVEGRINSGEENEIRLTDEYRIWVYELYWWVDWIFGN